MNKIFNFIWGTISVMYDLADPKTPTKMMIYDVIGKNPWTDGGISDSDFVKGLNEAAADRELHIHVNSRGGDVHHGFTMHNNLLAWKDRTKQKVVTVIDGVAASTASWAFPMASDEVRAYKGSQIFVHDAIGGVYGNAADHREVADKLDKTSGQIADMYATKSGKSKKSMRDLMHANTLMTAEEAEEEGLVDTIIDAKAVKNFTPSEKVEMTNHLASMYNVAAKRGDTTNTASKIMKKSKLIEMLNKLGVTEWNGKTLNEDTPDEDLQAALESATTNLQNLQRTAQRQDSSAENLTAINKMQAQIKLLEAANLSIEASNKVQRELNFGTELDKLIINDQMTIAERPKALIRCMNDATYLDELKSRPQNKPGSGALRTLTECVGNSFAEIQNYVLDNGPRFMNNFIGARVDGRLGEKTLDDIKNHAIMVANTIKKHKAMLIEMFNANTIDAGLQRQIIIQEMLEEFAIVLLPFQNFSTVFANVPLEGTDEVDVPFYALATDTGNSWDPAVGYNTMGSTATATRPVVIGGSGTTSGSNAPANTAKDRKWVGAQFSSYEMARQPYLNVQKLMIQKANALAVAIFKDVVSRVITAGNFGASVKAVPAAQFSPDDIADLWENATGRNWPARGRCLTLTHKYKTPLLKDTTFKSYLAYGATDPIRKAMIQEAYGFEDIPVVPNLDTYGPAGEFLQGWISWQYAVLMATAPIMPTAEVRALMTRYDIAVHPTIGIALEYRRFGDTTLDLTKETIECSYGAGKGVASALARITSQ